MEDSHLNKSAKFNSPLKKTRRCFVKIQSKRGNLNANYTKQDRSCSITIPDNIDMRHNQFVFESKDSEDMLNRGYIDEDLGDNPTYEDPRDVIGVKPIKPPRKCTARPLSPRIVSKDGKTLLKEQKKKLSKKYEHLIVTLMERCEENIEVINDKESQITKLKTKLKSVLEYNKRFAQENDKLKDQHHSLLAFVEDCKSVVQDLEVRKQQLEMRNEELEQRVRTFEIPDRDTNIPQPIPLVEVCMSCSNRQILATQLKEHNNRLLKDMGAMKELFYKLNIQLARYQEKVRANVTSFSRNEKNPNSAVDSLTTSLGHKTVPEILHMDELSGKSGNANNLNQGQPSSKVVDLSGLLSAQALAPLLDAYQENIIEKESLIHDYEKQFENINKKSKQLLEDNKKLQQQLLNAEEELVSLRRKEKKLSLDTETREIEMETLAERADKAEKKLKEVYELYEDKMAAMMRDYEAVHREYFSVRNALLANEDKMARTVPADLHEMRVRDCKRLLKELKHQYRIESEKKTEQLAKLKEDKLVLEERLANSCKEHEKLTQDLQKALKSVRQYRRAAVIFRARLKSSMGSLALGKRGGRGANVARIMDSIRMEIKAVKQRAYKSLEELEHRIREQERRAKRAEEEYRRELERSQLVLEHKENIIKSLIGKVADVEEVRLSQSNTHRLQGIADSPKSSSEGKEIEDRGQKEKEIARRDKSRLK